MTTDLRLPIGSNLSRIISLCRNLEDEAAHRFADKDLPGGAALVMLGPVANLEAFNYRQLSEIMGRTGNYGDEVDFPDTDPVPPLLVLAGWADVVAGERGDDRSRVRATIDSEVDYLRSVIDWIIGENADHEPYFLPAHELHLDLKRVVSSLEAVLKDGIRIDRGAPCMRCSTNLEKVWGDSEATDRWVCRTCDEWSGPESYRLAMRADYLRHAVSLKAADMLEEYRIKPGTLTGWASKGLVRKCGRDELGRLLYNVADALAQRDRQSVSA